MSLFVTFPEGPEEVILSTSDTEPSTGMSMFAAATGGKEIRIWVLCCGF